MVNYCNQNRQIGIIYYDYAFPIFNAFLTLSMIPAMYIYVKAYINKKLKSPKKVFITGIVFFMVIFILFTLRTFTSIWYCHHPNYYDIATVFTRQLYSIQCNILLGTLFYRLLMVFHDTVLALSKSSVKIFLSLYILTWILVAMGAILSPGSSISKVFGVPYAAAAAIGGFAFVMILFLCIFLVCLFIYKLIQVQKLNQQPAGSQLIEVITKTSLLCFISTFNIFVTAIFVLLTIQINSMHWHFIMGIVLDLDVYTNFLCVFLSYTYFNPLYVKLCGYCDNRCRRCWVRRLKSMNDLKMMTQVVSGSGGTGTSRNRADTTGTATTMGTTSPSMDSDPDPGIIPTLYNMSSKSLPERSVCGFIISTKDIGEVRKEDVEKEEVP